MSTRKIGHVLVRTLNDGAKSFQAVIQRDGVVHQLTFDNLEKAERWLNDQHLRAAEKRAEKRLQKKIEAQQNVQFNVEPRNENNELMDKIACLEEHILTINHKIEKEREILYEILDFCKKNLKESVCLKDL